MFIEHGTIFCLGLGAQTNLHYTAFGESVKNLIKSTHKI